MAEMFFTEALRSAMDEAMKADPAVILMGEDIGPYGGAFGVTGDLIETYGPGRVIETPISENGFVGVAVGAAMTGLKPVVEIMFMDFLLLASDQLINHAAKLHYIYDGKVNIPLVVRTPAGAGRGYGASHSQNLEAAFLSFPGMKIVAPATPADAKGLLMSAIEEPNPVLFVESKSLYGMRGDVPEGRHTVPLGKARVAREGDDLTLLAYGAGVGVCLEAASELADGGLESDVIDLRSLKPFDMDAVLASVKKTGRCIIFEEGHLTGGVGAELSALLMENCFSDLQAPVQRVASADVPYPSAISLEAAVTPSVDGIFAAAELLYE
jgi:pyruvate/2-oxoglutarate/acetoin dehydrogenase E1 component